MEWTREISSAIFAQNYDSEQIRLLFVILLALIGFSLAFAISIFANALYDPVKKRIHEAQNDDHKNNTNENRFLMNIGTILVPKAEVKRAKIAYQLETAGYRTSRALGLFYGIKLLGFVFAPFIVIGGIALFTNEPSLNYLSMAIIAGIIAFFVPNYWLMKMVKRRQQQLRHGLPDALDLMVVCAEAGLGLNSAISRVADEIGVQHPELAEELQLVMMQTRAGMDNRSALKELERRTGLEDISAFVTTILQSMRFGTSIGQSLRIFADEMRDKRLQRAQEKAARLSLTMLMPIVLCMLPMYVLIVLGPSLFSLARSFGNLSGGG